jgi:hypothetical protein
MMTSISTHMIQYATPLLFSKPPASPRDTLRNYTDTSPAGHESHARNELGSVGTAYNMRARRQRHPKLQPQP